MDLELCEHNPPRQLRHCQSDRIFPTVVVAAEKSLISRRSEAVLSAEGVPLRPG